MDFALAAYNAGPNKVEEWKKRYDTQDPMLFIDLIPYNETRTYVAKVLRNHYWYSALYERNVASQ
jgi:soluble lytic murein transglycosylase